jgi:hypothetical protein
VYETLAKKITEKHYMCEKHMQHTYETLANIHLENKMKHLEYTLETYVYSHCNSATFRSTFATLR